MTPITGSPVDRLLTWSLVASLALTHASSGLYAARGWEDPAAALLHIVGGALGALVVLRLLTALERTPRTAAATLLTGALGTTGVVGYGFNTIAVGLGGVDLIDASGVAVVLRVLGLLWPLSLLLAAAGLRRAGVVPWWCWAGTALGGLLYPVSRIANVGWLAVAADLVLLLCLSAVPVLARDAAGASAPSRSTAAAAR